MNFEERYWSERDRIITERTGITGTRIDIPLTQNVGWRNGVIPMRIITVGQVTAVMCSYFKYDLEPLSYPINTVFHTYYYIDNKQVQNYLVGAYHVKMTFDEIEDDVRSMASNINAKKELFPTYDNELNLNKFEPW